MESTIFPLNCLECLSIALFESGLVIPFPSPAYLFSFPLFLFLFPFLLEIYSKSSSLRFSFHSRETFGSNESNQFPSRGGQRTKNNNILSLEQSTSQWSSRLNKTRRRGSRARGWWFIPGDGSGSQQPPPSRQWIGGGNASVCIAQPGKTRISFRYSPPFSSSLSLSPYQRVLFPSASNAFIRSSSNATFYLPPGSFYLELFFSLSPFLE